MKSKNQMSSTNAKLRSAALCLVVACAGLVLGIADASAARGGGGGGGGGGGARAGGGGQMAQSSVSGAQRSMSGGAGTSANRPSTGNVSNNGNRTGNTVNGGNNNINTGNNNNKVNTGNVNVGNDVNINIDGGSGCCHGGGYYHPIAAGVAIGAVAVTTAAVVGSYYSTLPVGCSTVIKGGVSYSYCGSVYYKQTWQGNNVVYVVASP